MFHQLDVFCRKVHDTWWLLHAGDHKCFTPTFYFSIAALLVAIMIPAGTWAFPHFCTGQILNKNFASLTANDKTGSTYYWLYQKPAEERQKVNFIPLTGHYKQEYWYVF